MLPCRATSVCIGTVGIVKANFTMEEPLYAQRFICDLRSADSFVSRVSRQNSVVENKENKQTNKQTAGPMSPRPLEALANTCEQKKRREKKKRKKSNKR